MKKTLLFVSALMVGSMGFAQDIPNGTFEDFTTATKAASWSEIVTYNISGAITTVVPLSATNASAAGGSHLGDSAIVVHSVSVSGNWLPGVSISGASASMTINATVDGTLAVIGTPTTDTYGSIPTPGGKIPKALSGFARYRTAAGEAQKGGIAVEAYFGGVRVATYTGNTKFQYLIDTVAADGGYEAFNIPITKLPAATSDDCDSIRISLISATSTDDSIGVDDSLWVDQLRFLSCLPNPAIVLVPNGAPALDPATADAEIANEAEHSQVFTMAVNSPATINFQGIDVSVENMDSIRFDQISGLPTGIELVCGHPSCIVYGNSVGCFTVAGTAAASASNTVFHPITFITAFGQSSTAGSFLGDPELANTGSIALDTATFIVGDTITGIEDLDASKFDVAQNAPNPFSGSTSISFTTPTAGDVTFTVINVLGEAVSTSTVSAGVGVNTFTYDASALESGTYFYSLSNGTDAITKKLVVN